MKNKINFIFKQVEDRAEEIINIEINNSKHVLYSDCYTHVQVVALTV